MIKNILFIYYNVFQEDVKKRKIKFWFKFSTLSDKKCRTNSFRSDEDRCCSKTNFSLL